MILHQAQRPTHPSPEPETTGTTPEAKAAEEAAHSLTTRSLTTHGSSAATRHAAHSGFGSATGLLGRTARPSALPGPGSMGRGLSAVLADERRQWWPPTATRARFDRSGDEASGRWPTPTADEPRMSRQVLGTGHESPRLARDFTRATLAEWRISRLNDEALLIVSELVTNALCHGLEGVPLVAQQCPVQLVLLGHRRRLVIVVTDPGAGVPARSERGPAAENGRGLCVIEGVSAAWGWAPLATGGKAVWAALEITPVTGAPS